MLATTWRNRPPEGREGDEGSDLYLRVDIRRRRLRARQPVRRIADLRLLRRHQARAALVVLRPGGELQPDYRARHPGRLARPGLRELAPRPRLGSRVVTG